MNKKSLALLPGNPKCTIASCWMASLGFVYGLRIPIADVHRDVKWFKSASLNMHNYVVWCLRLRLGVRLYFAILRCWQETFFVRWFYWSAQTIRVVSQIYREQNNRGDVSQSEDTDVTITDKTDWTILILHLILVCSLLWVGMAKEVPSN